MDNLKPYNLSFDVTKKEKVRIELKQYDSNTRLLMVELKQFGEPLALSRSSSAYFYSIKPDGFKVFNEALIVSYEEGKILVKLTNQCLSTVGNSRCEIVIKNINKDQHLSSFPFIITVTESCYSDESHRSMHEDGAFEKLSKKVDDAIFGDIDMSQYYTIDEVDYKIENINTSEIKYSTSDDPSIVTLKDALDKLLYSPLEIRSFSISKGVAEKGEIVNNLTLSWNLNKDIIAAQSINNIEVENSIRNYIIDKSVTTDSSYSLSVSDGKSAVSKTAKIDFYNGKYYGVSSAISQDNDFILGLNKTLSNSRAQTFNVNCLVGQKIYYCIPTRLGTPTFTVEGFQGGFNKVKTMAFTNIFGFTENYDIWQSTNSGLGNTTVVVV